MTQFQWLYHQCFKNKINCRFLYPMWLKADPRLSWILRLAIADSSCMVQFRDMILFWFMVDEGLCSCAHWNRTRYNCLLYNLLTSQFILYTHNFDCSLFNSPSSYLFWTTSRPQALFKLKQIKKIAQFIGWVTYRTCIWVLLVLLLEVFRSLKELVYWYCWAWTEKHLSWLH